MTTRFFIASPATRKPVAADVSQSCADVADSLQPSEFRNLWSSPRAGFLQTGGRSNGHHGDANAGIDIADGPGVDLK
jgi:hypothetical protein